MRTITTFFAVIGFSFSVLGMEPSPSYLIKNLDLETYKSMYSQLLVGKTEEERKTQVSLFSKQGIDLQLLLVPPKDFFKDHSDEEMKLLSPFLSTVLWHRYKAGPLNRFTIAFKELGFTLPNQIFAGILWNIHCCNKKKRTWPALSMHPDFTAKKSYAFVLFNDSQLGEAEYNIGLQLVLLFNALTKMEFGPASLSGPILAISGMKK